MKRNLLYINIFASMLHACRSKGPCLEGSIR